MTALHWICVVTLALICRLTAFPLTSEFPEIIDYVDEFYKKVQQLACLDSDAKYYSPVNVPENCLISALNCSIMELNVLVKECTPESAAFQKISDDLLTSLYDILEGGSSCSEDEFYCYYFGQKNFKNFMIDIKTLLEQISAKS